MVQFSEVDREGQEATGLLQVTVNKQGTNIGNINVAVTPLTIGDFLSMNMNQFPPYFSGLAIPDPAECETLLPQHILITVITL